MQTQRIGNAAIIGFSSTTLKQGSPGNFGFDSSAQRLMAFLANLLSSLLFIDKILCASGLLIDEDIYSYVQGGHEGAKPPPSGLPGNLLQRSSSAHVVQPDIERVRRPPQQVVIKRLIERKSNYLLRKSCKSFRLALTPSFLHTDLTSRSSMYEFPLKQRVFASATCSDIPH
jgi:hypothetical protein